MEKLSSDFLGRPLVRVGWIDLQLKRSAWIKLLFLERSAGKMRYKSSWRFLTIRE